MWPSYKAFVCLLSEQKLDNFRSIKPPYQGGWGLKTMLLRRPGVKTPRLEGYTHK
jgi:hypothetical protein